MAQLIVTQSHDYRGETLTNITEIVFQGTGLFATFGAEQFGGSGISNNVTLTRDFGFTGETMRVILPAPGAFSAAGWTFNGFNAGSPDAIELIGTGGADTITGSSISDFIVGGAGADTLNGGNGGDWFRYLASGEAAAGETVNGDAGVDIVQLSESSAQVPITLDFTGVTFNSVEELRFFNSASATFTGAGLASFGSVWGSSGINHLIVNGSSIDLSAVDFLGWGPGFPEFPPPLHPLGDIVEINGTAGANSITGTEVDDIIRAGAGADTVAGGPGDDRLVYAPGDGGDTFVGFVAGPSTDDKVDVNAFGNLGTFDDLMTLATQNGADVVINFGGGDTLTLQNVQKTSLVREDFVGVRAVSQDLNGEGRSDILWQHDNGGLLMWDGADPSDYSSINGQSSEWHFEGPGDFNGDGIADTLWRNDTGRVQIHEMGPNGHFHFIEGVSTDWDIADIGYFNGDATSDILWRHQSGQLAIWDMKDGEQSGYHFVGAVGPDWALTDTGDFNGDGQTDILWRHTTGAAAIWDIVNGQQAGYHFLGPVGNEWSVADIGDFNGDRTADILWQHDSGQLAIWDMNGGQQSGYHFLGFVDGDWTLADTNDYNGDGQTDILWRHHSGAVAVWDIDDSQQAGYHFLGHVDNVWHVL